LRAGRAAGAAEAVEEYLWIDGVYEFFKNGVPNFKTKHKDALGPIFLFHAREGQLATHYRWFAILLPTTRWIPI